MWGGSAWVASVGVVGAEADEAGEDEEEAEDEDEEEAAADVDELCRAEKEEANTRRNMSEA